MASVVSSCALKDVETLRLTPKVVMGISLSRFDVVRVLLTSISDKFGLAVVDGPPERRVVPSRRRNLDQKDCLNAFIKFWTVVRAL